MFYPIQLDKMRNFRFGMKAISLLEKKFDKSIGNIDMSNMTMEDTAYLIWAGLQHEDKELTPDKVMELIDDYSSLPEVTKALGAALEQAFGSKDQNPNEGNNEKNA